MNNGKKLNLEDYKNISLKILIDVAGFCDKNNIIYYLACGTLLGAIRHKGFIPWDDDIDIMMPRNEYKKFLKSYQSKNYQLLNPSDGIFFYAKVYDKKTIVYEQMFDRKKVNPIGVSIDIFPLDGIVNDDIVVNKLRNKSNFFETLLRLSNQPLFYRKNPLKAINRIVPRIIGSKNIVKIIESIDQTYDYEKSDYVIRFKTTPNGINRALPKSVYELDKKEFEGHLFNVPKNYDLWLRSFFGEDYMKLPSKEKQIPHEREGYYI